MHSATLRPKYTNHLPFLGSVDPAHADRPHIICCIAPFLMISWYSTSTVFPLLLSFFEHPIAGNKGVHLSPASQDSRLASAPASAGLAPPRYGHPHLFPPSSVPFLRDKFYFVLVPRPGLVNFVLHVTFQLNLDSDGRYQLFAPILPPTQRRIVYSLGST
ncbi:hypothetical protein MVEN_00101400 [Mycena venus]|uniref:Uncharacterized protein n=1 Tax=Mycena venus TaxID=2733690 RepID=A0A8H7DHH4_9AGAR|nr:hypothetical protein MVEN_00101400 [Mycena venus]